MPVLTYIYAYFVEAWPSVIFVACLATTIHHGGLDWFDALDGYAFTAIGNLSSRPVAVNSDQSSSLPNPSSDLNVMVVLIDKGTHESRYLEQSPLNRCSLHEDLQRLYQEQPALVAIDLDISPALWLHPEGSHSFKDWWDESLAASENRLTRLAAKNRNQAICELQLYNLLIRHATTVKTVLMLPFDVISPRMTGIIKRWQLKMEENGIRFGSADLVIKYGLVLHNYMDSHTIAGAINDALGKPKVKNGQHAKLINPRTYRQLAPVELGEFTPEKYSKLRGGTVFFGGGWGESDTYITPVGEVYGVEVHAATYLSIAQSVDDLGALWGLLADIVFAFFSGLVISWCWKSYFHARLKLEDCQSHRATINMAILLVLVSLFLIASLVASFFLLDTWGIWASPVPVLMGMMIDSLVLDSVAEAIHASGDQEHRARGFQDLWRAKCRRAASVMLLRRLLWLAVVLSAFIAIGSQVH